MSNEEKEKANEKKKKMLEYLKDLDTKGNVAHSGIELVKTMAITGLGILVGAQLGRPSLIAGMAAAFAGNYIDQPKLTQLGIGLMASGGYQLKEKGFSGLEGVK